MVLRFQKKTQILIPAAPNHTIDDVAFITKTDPLSDHDLTGLITLSSQNISCCLVIDTLLSDTQVHNSNSFPPEIKLTYIPCPPSLLLHHSPISSCFVCETTLEFLECIRLRGVVEWKNEEQWPICGGFLPPIPSSSFPSPSFSSISNSLPKTGYLPHLVITGHESGALLFWRIIQARCDLIYILNVLGDASVGDPTVSHINFCSLSKFLFLSMRSGEIFFYSFIDGSLSRIETTLVSPLPPVGQSCTVPSFKKHFSQMEATKRREKQSVRPPKDEATIWNEFFLSAEIDEKSSAEYSAQFVRQKISTDFVKELTLEMLEMAGINSVGDKMRIIKRAKQIASSSSVGCGGKVSLLDGGHQPELCKSAPGFHPIVMARIPALVHFSVLHFGLSRLTFVDDEKKVWIVDLNSSTVLFIYQMSDPIIYITIDQNLCTKKNESPASIGAEERGREATAKATLQIEPHVFIVTSNSLITKISLVDHSISQSTINSKKTLFQAILIDENGKKVAPTITLEEQRRPITTISSRISKVLPKLVSSVPPRYLVLGYQEEIKLVNLVNNQICGQRRTSFRPASFYTICHPTHQRHLLLTVTTGGDLVLNSLLDQRDDLPLITTVKSALVGWSILYRSSDLANRLFGSDDGRFVMVTPENEITRFSIFKGENSAGIPNSLPDIFRPEIKSPVKPPASGGLLSIFNTPVDFNILFGRTIFEEEPKVEVGQQAAEKDIQERGRKEHERLMQEQQQQKEQETPLHLKQEQEHLKQKELQELETKRQQVQVQEQKKKPATPTPTPTAKVVFSSKQAEEDDRKRKELYGSGYTIGSSSSSSSSKKSSIIGDIASVMQQNMQSLMERGEKLQKIKSQSEQVSTNTSDFRDVCEAVQSKTYQKKGWLDK